MAWIKPFLEWLRATDGVVTIERPLVGNALVLAAEVRPPSRIAKIVDAPNEAPQFKRTYSGRVGEHRIEIEAKGIGGWLGRRYSGMLVQSGNRYVFFDPERIADKILDRDLVPSIEAFVREALAIDQAFVNAGPSRFTDDRGCQWALVG